VVGDLALSLAEQGLPKHAQDLFTVRQVDLADAPAGRLLASPSGGTSHTSTATVAPPDATRIMAGCRSLIDQSR